MAACGWCFLRMASSSFRYPLAPWPGKGAGLYEDDVPLLTAQGLSEERAVARLALAGGDASVDAANNLHYLVVQVDVDVVVRVAPVLERSTVKHCAVDAQVADVTSRTFDDERQTGNSVERETVADVQDFEIGLLE